MPTYAYVCKACGHAFDIVQSFSDDSLTECRQCGGQLRKKFGNVGVTFKGSGFYRTDSRGSSSSATSGGDSGAKSSESTSGSSADSAKSSGPGDSGSSSSSSSTAKTPAASAS
ncbi:FmdB family zinc ribbon protein [Nesterenkonia ebinurensis]|uniref:FmdB family zinc ribbon protein n=1 Tax=Nesterenkonia ebinurensis TaxID=2608252 RepID=UPI00123E135D|nr:FmdB family zinc ribbon protein [Nesterenkonia ebinurensis]